MSDTLIRPLASIDWSEPATPRAAGGDVYFSAEDGLAETRAVFLAGCRLQERFAAGGTIIIGELGFGTGLNFLAAWQLFETVAPASARLHFVSLEGFPLSQSDARRALSAFGELSGKAGALADSWPAALKGPHRRVFAEGRVMLTVSHDTVEAALGAMDFAADAWFLDGFAPSLNGEMWSPEVFAHIARLSRPGTRLGTFTVAGAVRRGLQDAGFAVEKVPGFGRKRERLEAVFDGPDASRPAAPPPSSVAIIGGGIAAASLVHALSLRAITPVVIAEGGWGAGASGGPAALLTPRLEAADRPHVRATLAAFDYARALFTGLDGFHPSGVMRAASGNDSDGRLARIAAMMAGTGISVEGSALRLERAGWVEPSRLVPALAGPADIINARAARIERTASGWHVLDGSGNTLAEASHLILAPGAGALPEGAPLCLPRETLPGQIARFAYQGPAIPRPMAWGHYLAPLPDGSVLAGATHERTQRLTPEVAAAQIRDAVTAFDPAIGASLGSVLEHWGASRCVLPDRLPASGSAVTADGSAIDGLYVLGGFGARGFAHAPLLAEHLVSVLGGEPSPLERSGAAALDPARFALRALRRQGRPLA